VVDGSVVVVVVDVLPVDGSVVVVVVVVVPHDPLPPELPPRLVPPPTGVLGPWTVGVPPPECGPLWCAWKMVVATGAAARLEALAAAPADTGAAADGVCRGTVMAHDVDAATAEPEMAAPPTVQPPWVTPTT
jgi:hypothetical protein